jgi:phosphatidylglycerophosphatase A
MNANDSSVGDKRLAFGPRHPAWQLATWFGVGLMPKAPGTWGSLVAVPFAYGIHHLAGPVGLLLAALALCALGAWAADEFSRRAVTRDPGVPDPQAVVVDEVAGQWLALVPAGNDILFYAAGFLLFRLFDIWKPWPASWADRRVKGGLGIMLDDVIAGAYAALVLWGATTWLARS